MENGQSERTQDEQQGKPKQRRNADGAARRGKRAKASPPKEAEPQNELLRDIQDELLSLRRKVAFQSDVEHLGGDIEDRLSMLNDKVDYISHAVHAIQCILEQTLANTTYTGGY